MYNTSAAVTLTLGELLLTTLKMLTRQRRMVIRSPILPATTCHNQGCRYHDSEEDMEYFWEQGIT